MATSSVLAAKSLSRDETYVDVFNAHTSSISNRYSDEQFLFRAYFKRDQDGKLVDDGIKVRGDSFITRGCVRMAHIPAE